MPSTGKTRTPSSPAFATMLCGRARAVFRESEVSTAVGRRYESGTDVIRVWETYHAEAAEIIELDDGRVFVGWLTTARGGSSGAETEFRAWTIFSFAGGKIARREAFRERAEALEAAGLSE
jgi:hypothetical protein